jgi:hypothetical protein
VPADRPPRGPRARRTRRHPDPLDERQGRLERLWSLVLRRFRDAAEATESADGPATNTDKPDEERDDHT